MTDRRDILTTALELIDGDRARTYGPPEVGFQRTADLWTAMGFRMEGRPLTAVDVSLALTQLKVSRIIGQPDHEDSWIDGPGYFALGGEIALAGKHTPEPFETVKIVDDSSTRAFAERAYLEFVPGVPRVR